jgi:hypothetical protein
LGRLAPFFLVHWEQGGAKRRVRVEACGHQDVVNYVAIMDPQNTSGRLMWHDIFLFLLGLLTGLLVPALHNARMGVSAHLEAVMNGTFLVVLGLIWKEAKLTTKAAPATFAIALYETVELGGHAAFCRVHRRLRTDFSFNRNDDMLRARFVGPAQALQGIKIWLSQ